MKGMFVDAEEKQVEINWSSTLELDLSTLLVKYTHIYVCICMYMYVYVCISISIVLCFFVFLSLAKRNETPTAKTYRNSCGFAFLSNQQWLVQWLVVGM